MPTSYIVALDDTSPVVTYSPPLALSSVFPQPQSDLDQGWVAKFDDQFITENGTIGTGSSTHVTSLDGASFQFSFTGAQDRNRCLVACAADARPSIPSASSIYDRQELRSRYSVYQGVRPTPWYWTVRMRAASLILLIRFCSIKVV